MNVGISANRQEILQIADAVAREKSIDREVVIAAMADAIARAAKSRYGAEFDIRAEIDSKTGEVLLKRVQMVVEGVENDKTEISLKFAQRKKPDAKIGDEIIDILPPVDFGRVAALTAKQVITQRVRDAERDRQFEEYKDRIGEIVNGTVKRAEYGNVIVDLGRGEGIIRRDQGIPRENFQMGDRVRAYIYDVRRETKGPQIFLSRAHGQFMVKLFAAEVPEIYDNIIEIKAVSRDPGSRAKIAVISYDNSIDPVGACVGMRGARVQAVVGELQGEKIDIIPWSENAAGFIVNALQPAEVSKVVMDEEQNRVEVVVPDGQLSLAIGRRGQNVRLASQLTGWQIDIITETVDSERRQKEFEERTKLFGDALGLDETLSQLLAAEGFTSVEEIALTNPEDLERIDGVDEALANDLQSRAANYIERVETEQLARCQELGVEQSLLDADGMTLAMAVKLAEEGYKNLEDLAGLTGEELRGWTEVDRKTGEKKKEPGVLESFNLSAQVADDMILNARIAMGWIEAPVSDEVLDETFIEGEDDEIVAEFEDGYDAEDIIADEATVDTQGDDDLDDR